MSTVNHHVHETSLCSSELCDIVCYPDGGSHEKVDTFVLKGWPQATIMLRFCHLSVQLLIKGTGCTNEICPPSITPPGAEDGTTVSCLMPNSDPTM